MGMSRWWRHPVSLTVAAALGIVTLHQIGWIAGLETAVIKTLAPVQTLAGYGTNGVVGWLQGWQSAGSLREENRRLQAALLRRTVENQELREYAEELTELAAQSEFARRKSWRTVTARVVGKTLGQDAQVLTLDSGTQAGIRVGLPVIAREGVLIGRVVEASLGYAKVMLLTDGRSATPAALQTNLAASGVVSGEFGISLKMDLVPKDQVLREGEVVITSGLEAALPRGLLIGQVTRLDRSPSPFFQAAYLKPLVLYQTLPVVSVLMTR